MEARTQSLPVPSASRRQFIPSIRRKPQITYKSPSGNESHSTVHLISTTLSHTLSSPLITQSSPLAPTGASSLPHDFQNTLRRKKYPMHPPLPLYHPLGRLALSLPPLDPSTFGLPQPPLRIDDAVRRSSARARRPAAKLRDAEEEVLTPLPPVNTAATVVSRDIKDKPSPRKKRAGGASGSKRKRKEVDDGDATYPAKRTRIPRGSASHAADDDSQTESIVPVAEVASMAEPMIEASDDKRPERRSTRSRGTTKRRDSSASDATSMSASVGATTTLATTNDMEVENEKFVVPEEHQINGKTEKEDGELSEESLTKLVP